MNETASRMQCQGNISRHKQNTSSTSGTDPAFFALWGRICLTPDSAFVWQRICLTPDMSDNSQGSDWRHCLTDSFSAFVWLSVSFVWRCDWLCLTTVRPVSQLQVVSQALRLPICLTTARQPSGIVSRKSSGAVQASAGPLRGPPVTTSVIHMACLEQVHLLPDMLRHLGRWVSPDLLVVGRLNFAWKVNSHLMKAKTAVCEYLDYVLLRLPGFWNQWSK